MKFYIAQETTDWSDGSDSNHIYVFAEKPSGRSAPCIAYVEKGTDTVIKFKKPIALDLKGRTFVPL